MADWSTVTATSKKTVARPNSGVQTNGTSWVNAAGRKAGNGTVQSIGRAPVQSKDKNPKRTTPVDPVASQQAAMRAIAKEALEHAMESRGDAREVELELELKCRVWPSVGEAPLTPLLWPADLAVMTAAVQQHKAGGEGTDALWRANAMVKELTVLAKQARKQAAVVAVAPSAAAPTSEAEAVAALEEAMAGGDLTALKAAILARRWRPLTCSQPCSKLLSNPTLCPVPFPPP